MLFGLVTTHFVRYSYSGHSLAKHYIDQPSVLLLCFSSVVAVIVCLSVRMPLVCLSLDYNTYNDNLDTALPLVFNFFLWVGCSRRQRRSFDYFCFRCSKNSNKYWRCSDYQRALRNVHKSLGRRMKWCGRCYVHLYLWRLHICTHLQMTAPSSQHCTYQTGTHLSTLLLHKYAYVLIYVCVFCF